MNAGAPKTFAKVDINKELSKYIVTSHGKSPKQTTFNLDSQPSEEELMVPRIRYVPEENQAILKARLNQTEPVFESIRPSEHKLEIPMLERKYN